MNLIKTSFLSAISTGVKIGAVFISNKVVASLLGPPGIALMGQFNNFTNIMISLGSGAINTGVVKYASEYHGNEENTRRLIGTSFRITLTCSLLLGFIIFLLRETLSRYLFGTPEYTSVLSIFSIAIVFFSLNALFLSLLNGKKQIKKFIAISILSSIIILVLTVALVYALGLYGALLALATAQTSVFLITLLFVYRSPWFSAGYLLSGFHRITGSRLFRFTLMSLVSALLYPVAQLFLRRYIMQNISVDAAGYWQAVSRISESYLLLVTTSISTYYLPKLSSLKTRPELRAEILQGYRILMPIVLVSCIGIYLFRTMIIRLLFSEAFLPMESLFAWQLAGDFFKIASWILAYLMLARAMTKHFIITEIVFTFTYALFAFIFLQYMGVMGMTVAFALNYFLYLITMILIFKDVLFIKGGRK